MEEEKTDSAYDVLVKRIYDDQKFDLHKYGRSHVQRRLNVRVMNLGFPQNDWVSYMKVLEATPSGYFL